MICESSQKQQRTWWRIAELRVTPTDNALFELTRALIF